MTDLDSMLKSRDMTLPTKVPTVKAMVFPAVTYGCESWTVRRQSIRELMPSNCSAGEDSWKSCGQQGDQTVNLKGNQPRIFIGRTDASLSSSTLITWCEQPTHWKSPWERLRAEGEEGVRGWDGWMASLMQWAWTWANFRRWWGTGRSGVVQSMGSQRVGHNWATEQQQQSED